MPETYSEHFTPIRKRLESLKGAIEQDMPRLEESALDMTFRQVIGLVDGLDTVLSTYKTTMSPLYRNARKSRTPGSGGSYYQRRRAREEDVAKRAQESVQKQGYVTVASIMTETGYRENTTQKVLESLAEERGWEKKRDRETKTYRYAPKAQPQAPEAPAGNS